MINTSRPNMQKASFLLLAILAFCFSGKAQSYNNEWINFNNTYYKFKVGKEGLYQIPFSTLQAAGLDATPVEQFKLFRNGQEVPLYTSAASGAMTASDYLEFWGKPNDGEPDRPLYRQASFQHVTDYSLHSDTAIYFLTVDPSAVNKRFQVMPNDVAGNTLPVEPYFMYNAGKRYKEKINPGFAADLSEYVYSSSYDRGEFWSSADIKERGTRTENISNLKVSATGPDPIVRFGAFGNSSRTRRIQVKVNGTLVQDTAMNFFSDLVSSASFSLSQLASGSASVAFTDVQPPAIPNENYTDRMVLSFFDLIYPRQFDFNNLSSFTFDLDARAIGYYLEIKNFNSSGAKPVLYDVNNAERYIANTDVAGKLRFALPGSSAARKLILINPQPANIFQVSSLVSRKFTDFSNPAAQGNYLIVSNPKLYTGTDGGNPVESYRAYRSTPSGGGFNSKVYDINELIDQFAFGIKGHPLAVRNFIRFARDRFTGGISNVFLIGKGVSYPFYRSSPNVEQTQLSSLNLIPTFGYPGSDNMLSAATSSTSFPATPIGRLSVISPVEIENYLDKVKQFESAQQNSPNTKDGRLWMKDGIHVTGSNDASIGVFLCNNVNNYKNIIEDTFSGNQITVLCSTGGSSTGLSGTKALREGFANGINTLTYFGHSSSTTLEFNLEDPDAYNNTGKYPFFSVMGCYAGDLFQYDLARFSTLSTISEKYTLIKQKGGIAFLASTHFGEAIVLSNYMDLYFKRLANKDYGASIGKLNADALSDLIQLYGTYDFLARTHGEQINLHGDPALVVSYASKPDFDIEESFIKVSPNPVSVADQTFKLQIKYFNLGKATNDSMHLEVKRVLPNGVVTLIYSGMRPPVYYGDSIEFEVPVQSLTDKGANKILVTLDGKGLVDEMDEGNNSIVNTFFIFEDGLTPVYPYQYAIVSDPAQKLFASTANPFYPLKSYVLEIDTTALFNSSVKKIVNQASKGGILEFDPQVTFQDSTVYYWRTAPVPDDGVTFQWSQSSFQFRSNGKQGFNQSHYYQHLKSKLTGLSLKENRQWDFNLINNDITIKQGLYPTSGSQDGDFAVVINDQEFIKSACVGRSLIFNIIDPNTFEPWLNVDANGNNLYRFGSGSANCKPSRNWNFEFSYMTAASRKLIMDFMDSIPAGSYVIVRSFDYNNPNSYAATWRADTALYGSGKSLYHKLLQAGFTTIDQLTAPKCWAMVYKKGDLNFQVQAKISAGLYDKVSFSSVCTSPDSVGYIQSPDFGPAKAWKEIHFRGHQLNNESNDQATVALYGKTSGNAISLLREYPLTVQDADISDIDAQQYPILYMKMRNADSVAFTPYQLDYWKLTYDPVPEGAVAPNLFLLTKDTLEIGEQISFGIAFKNVSKVAFDSLRIKVVLTDNKNVPHLIPQNLLKPLVSGDTVIFRINVDTRNYPGLNTLFLEFNPDNSQPEQYHLNNFVYKGIYVKYDNTNPLLDVTFDGTHILNGDIVSAKPWIQIKLKDESKYLMLKDTSLLKIRVKYPNGTIKMYRYDNDTVRFTPAINATDNTATVDFRPSFLETFSTDGIDNYELTVTGMDASNNPAGKTDYNISFLVINKPMISNLLNYPNPFTTSTAFVFTITGSEIPNNFKIQIMTVTGKIVKEITGDELGPLHIGRNITEYKWDGTDQFGQRLGNGVYLYRVITTLNGKKLDKFTSDRDNTDKFFTRGYGKMYLMR